MKILVTCGPSYEPIDQVRRMTNFSTGRLGITLANFLFQEGHEVICLKGEGSTFPGPVATPQLEIFSTNDDLAQRLAILSRSESIDAVFHAAALCDYKVAQVLAATGETISSPKFATRDGPLQIMIEPALKVLPKMRDWFPNALIAGWKYELAGTRDQALAKAWNQIHECRTDACVLNGAAYGEGFALCQTIGGLAQPCADAASLCRALEDWLRAATKAASFRQP